MTESASTGAEAGAPIRISVRDESDIAMARKRIREMTAQESWPESAVAALATAISEIARNILVHAGAGYILMSITSDGGRRGIMVIAHDEGPGIPDLEQVMRDGYSTASSLGLGLPSARRLVDSFELSSTPGKGTTVTMKKWAPGARRQ